MEFKFDEALFYRIIGVNDGGIRYYNHSTLTENESIFSIEKFRHVFTKGQKFEKSEKRMTTTFDAYGRLKQHILSTIVLPNADHKKLSYIFSDGAALHEGKKFNFGHIALEHKLDARRKNGKFLPYGCLLTKFSSTSKSNLKKRFQEETNKSIIK